MSRPAAPPAETSAAPLSALRLWCMLTVLSAATFLLTTSGLALAPFFNDLAADLGVPLIAITNLLAVMAVAWGVSALIAGGLSDRLGRRPILIASVLSMGCAQLGLSQAPNYSLALACQVLAGLSGGAFMGVVFAAVSDQVAERRRGRALGWLITGQSLSLVLGVPLMALLGSAGGWRQALSIYGVTTALMALAVWRLTPGRSRAPPSRSETRAVAFRELLRAPILLLLLAGVAERVCFAVVAVYMAIYLQSSYQVPLSQLAVGLALIAAGNVVGNIVGGQITDRIDGRTLFYALSSLTTALLALPLLLWQPGLYGSLAMGFGYSFANAVGRPALLAVLSEVPAAVRGAVFGVNITTSSLGWLAASALGGWLVTAFGFASLGVLCALAALAGAAFGLLHHRLRRR